MINRIKNYNFDWYFIILSSYIFIGLTLSKRTRFLYVFLCLILPITIYILKNKPKYNFSNAKLRNVVFSVLIWLMLTIRFTYELFKKQIIENYLNIKTNYFIIFLIIIILTVFSLVFINCCLSYIDKFLKSSRKEISIIHNLIDKKYYVVLFVISVTIITLCSKSSPIYPFNDWVDANAFFTVGKSMFSGRVLYKDIYEQKGFYTYVICGLGYLLSNKSFIGMYFIEIMLCYITLLFLTKTIVLISNNKSYLLLPILFSGCLCTRSFEMGVSCEEFAMPLVSFALYLGVKIIINNEEFNFKNLFLLGITSGVVLWTKFTLLGVYVGWIYIFFLIYKRVKDVKKIIKGILIIAFGVFVSTIPVLLYFGINNSFIYLFKVYFYDNIFIYSEKSAEQIWIIKYLDNIVDGINDIFQYNYVAAILLIISLFISRKINDDIGNFCFFTLLFQFIFVSAFGATRIYYVLIYSVYIVFAPIGLISFIKKENILTNYFLLITILLICVIFPYYKNDRFVDKNLLVQYRFSNVIDNYPGATLLEYDMQDRGLYTTTGIVPNCLYFEQQNINLPEILETQTKYVSQGLVDFVFVERDYDEKIFEKYEVIDEMNSYKLYKIRKLK